MRLLDRIIGKIGDFYTRFLFKFQPKEKNSIFFYPHPNCEPDHYDIIHYHSDNVLCLINYILRHKEYLNYSLFLVVYDSSKIATYQKYVSQLNADAKISFINNDRYQINKTAAKCSLLFTSTGGTYFKYRTSKQKVICLNYYIPFKSDYIIDKVIREVAKKRNGTFDNFIMTANIPCLISSVVRSFPLEQFLSLGFCRNDIFYNHSANIKDRLSNKLRFDVKKIIIYTPTYRDYEYEQSEIIQRDLFGYTDTNYDYLEKILSDNCCVVIAKLHPLQTNISVSVKAHPHIVMYSELNDLEYSLYEYLSEADGLITDYTSTYFDFLHRDKPVIFNFYDFEKYKETRGFSLNPIRPFCTGDQVENSDDLIEAIKRVAQGVDKYKDKREQIKILFDDFYDGYNTKRVCEYFLK